jgi:chromosome partitioning protein
MGKARMKIITIANEKGGVGKTTTTVNLAAALGLQGYQVLVIDLDGQGHATEWLGMPLSRVPNERSSFSVLANQSDMATSLIRTKEEQVLLCAAHPYLSTIDVVLASQPDAVFTLRDALHADLPVQIDYTLIDCPPGKGAVIFNALIAADLVLAPVLAEALSLKGLSSLNETVGRVQSRYSPQLPLPAILLNDYDGRSSADRQNQAYLRDQFGDRVFQTFIGRDAPLRECTALCESIFQYRRSARSASQFQELAREMLALLGQNESAS